jgi:hypothetical protein
MGCGGGIQFRIKRNRWHTGGSAQRVHTVEHPKLDVINVIWSDLIDLRQGQAIGPDPCGTVSRTCGQAGQCQSNQNGATMHSTI